MGVSVAGGRLYRKRGVATVVTSFENGIDRWIGDWWLGGSGEGGSWFVGGDRGLRAIGG